MAFTRGLMAIVERGRSFAPKEEFEGAAGGTFGQFSAPMDPTPRRPTVAPATRSHTPQSSRQEQMGFGGWGFRLPRLA